MTLKTRLEHQRLWTGELKFATNCLYVNGLADLARQTCSPKARSQRANFCLGGTFKTWLGAAGCRLTCRRAMSPAAGCGLT
jgi:hypothetical protein